MTTQHKHYELVKRAYSGISFSPEKRANDYCKLFDNDIEKLKSLNIPQSKIDKYERLWIEWMGAKGRCLSPMITGPANFPTARNEKANNSERNKGEACIDYYNTIVKYAEKEAYYEANPHARPVMSGDSDALERLQSKLEACKGAQETMKAVNKILRKKPVDEAALLKLLKTEEKVKEIQEPDCFGGIGFASYALTNNNAEINRLKGRIKQLTTRKEQGNKEINIGNIKVLQNSEDMRLQIFFDGKPAQEVIKLMKSNAFKWAPSKGAWQRQLTNNAIYSFNHYVLPELKKLEA